MKQVRDAIEAFGGRRFLMSLGCGAMTSALQWAGKLDPAGTTYAMVVIATVGAFIAGNTTQHIKAPPPPVAPPEKEGAAG